MGFWDRLKDTADQTEELVREELGRAAAKAAVSGARSKLDTALDETLSEGEAIVAREEAARAGRTPLPQVNPDDPAWAADVADHAAAPSARHPKLGYDQDDARAILDERAARKERAAAELARLEAARAAIPDDGDADP